MIAFSTITFLVSHHGVYVTSVVAISSTLEPTVSDIFPNAVTMAASTTPKMEIVRMMPSNWPLISDISAPPFFMCNIQPLHFYIQLSPSHRFVE